MNVEVVSMKCTAKKNKHVNLKTDPMKYTIENKQAHQCEEWFLKVHS